MLMCLDLNLFPTHRTQAQQPQHMLFDKEPCFSFNRLDHCGEILPTRELDHLMATATHKMVTVGQFGSGVAMAAIFEVDPTDVPQL